MPVQSSTPTDKHPSRRLSPTQTSTALRAACAAAPLSTIRQWARASDQRIGGTGYHAAVDQLAGALNNSLVPVSLTHLADELYRDCEPAATIAISGTLTLYGTGTAFALTQLQRRGPTITMAGCTAAGTTTITVHVRPEDPFISVDWIGLDALIPG
ncbi:hypothetical protein GS504_00885 [Rhodococcus hoagii]|nr:hypothetical protein [Prescottella equi]NKS72203.1 hypothetical protein [Prescottella equi]